MNVPLRSPAGPVPGGRTPVLLPEKSRRFAGLYALAAMALLPSSLHAAAILSWDFTGESTLATSTAEVKDTNLGGTSGTLTRGAGAAASAGNNSFRTVGFQNNGIAVANTDYFQTEITAASGFKVSLSTLDAKFAGTANYAASPGVSHQFAYSLDGTTFTLIGASPVVTTGTPATLPQVDVSGVAALQNVASGTTITLRYYASGQTSTGGWGFFSASAGTTGFEIGGTVATSGVDTTAPTISTLSPTNAATGVALASNLVATFNEPVVSIAGGTITLKKADNSTVETFTFPSAAVSIAGNAVTINPTADLLPSTGYYVQIDGVALEDAAGNNFAGYTGSSTWSFTTVAPDTTGPVVTGITPTAGSTGVALDVSPVLSFDENVNNGTGSVLIKNAANVTVATLDATDSGQVTTSNSASSHTVTLSIPPGALSASTQYYVQLPVGVIKDDLGNSNPAFGSVATSGFTTKALPVLTSSGPYTENFTSFTSATNLTDVTPILPFGWSVSGPALGYGGDWGGSNNAAGFRGGSAGLLGYQHTSGSSTLVETFTIVNGTGSTITDLVVGYTGLRTTNTSAGATFGRLPVFTVKIGETAVPALTYATTDPASSVKLAGISGLSIAPGAAFTLSWSSDRGTGSGSSYQVGIDDLTISAGTLNSAPVVTGPFATPGSLTHNSVEVNAETTADGGAAVTAMGFVYSQTSVNATPTIGGTGVTNVPFATPGVSTFLAPLSGLSPETSYSVRAYSTNSVGTNYTTAATIVTLAAPPSFTGTYTQDFDNFTGTLPAGWSISSTTGATTYNGVWDVTTTASAGLEGGVADPGVLGYQHTSTSGVFTAKLTLQNATGGVLDALNIAYLGRVGRVSDTNANRFPIWDVKVNDVSVEALAYTTEGGVDQTKLANLSSLGIANGANFTVSWSSDRGLGGGASKIIGLASVVVSTSPITVGGYDSWAAANADGAGKTADNDNDGIPNLLEYALGTNPKAGNGYPVTVSPTSVSYPKGAEASANGDVTYKIETSPTMAPGSWSPVSAIQSPTSISYTFPPGPVKYFARLVVE